MVKEKWKGKREKRGGERGHGKGKIKESSKTVCVSVVLMSSYRPGHNPTAVPLSDSLTLTHTQNIYSLHQADLPVNPARRLLTGHALYPSWPAPS